MKRALLVILALAAVAVVYALRPASRPATPAAPAKPPHGPTAVIDDASRAQLEKVLRDAAKEDVHPSARSAARPADRAKDR